MVNALIAALLSASTLGVAIPDADVQQQNDIFQQHWGTDFVWRFDDLPTKGGVEKVRVPYSGAIYLDRFGGTASALRKYDLAFHQGRMVATAFEQWDTTAFQEPVSRSAGVFGRRRVTSMATPNWHGHCNGWAAATIRHAEPQQSVRRGNVVFTPADIKALLAEIYIYNDIADLSGSSGNIQAGLFHAVVANWMGRGTHPLGMEADPGREKWNYPAFSYNSTFVKRSPRQVEVKLNLAYAKETQSEYQQGPRNSRVKYFHYRLDLNEAGEIVGGQFYGDSARIDMLWVPLQPKTGGQPGNDRGNPHVNIDEVLAIWRESVPAETRAAWRIADPAPADRLVDLPPREHLTPLAHTVLDAESLTSEPPAVEAESGDQSGGDAVGAAAAESTAENAM